MYTRKDIIRHEYYCDQCSMCTSDEEDMKRHYLIHSVLTVREGGTTFYLFENPESLHAIAHADYLFGLWDVPGWYVVDSTSIISARVYQRHIQERIEYNQAKLASIDKFLEEHPVEVKG